MDAAIATQLALAVVYPAAGNIGGGGFMVAHLADGRNIALDFREKAPAAATRDMYLDAAGNARTDLSQNGHLAAGVPGTIAGIFAGLKYARLPISTLIQPAKAGRITLIGVASEKRLPMLPDVPTFIEQGVPGMLGSTWASMIAPAGTPRDIVKRMSDAVNAIIQSDETKAKLDTMGTFGEGTTPEACDAFLAAETTKWGKVIRDAGVTLD